MTPGLLWLAQHAHALTRVRDRRLVIKVGGSIQDQPAVMKSLMGEAAALALLGAKVCVVHGGGKAISAAMNAAGLQPRFIGGQRYTDAATLLIAERVLALSVNAELVRYVNESGARATGLHSLGACVLKAGRTLPAKPELDLGLVGEVVDVDATVIGALCDAGVVPVIAPVALDAAMDDAHPSQGPGKLNVNADLAAGTVAAAIKPDALVLVSDTPGVRVKDGSYAKSLSREQVEALKREGVVDGGMLPKVRACEEALAAGVRDVCIVDGREPGSLLGAALGLEVRGTVFTN